MLSIIEFFGDVVKNRVDKDFGFGSLLFVEGGR